MSFAQFRLLCNYYKLLNLKDRPGVDKIVFLYTLLNVKIDGDYFTDKV